MTRKHRERRKPYSKLKPRKMERELTNSELAVRFGAVILVIILGAILEHFGY